MVVADVAADMKLETKMERKSFKFLFCLSSVWFVDIFALGKWVSSACMLAAGKLPGGLC